MNCPNFNIESVRDEFNKLVIAAGGEPLTIEEFKNKDLRNKRSGVDDLAMQVAYRKYDNSEQQVAFKQYVNRNRSSQDTQYQLPQGREVEEFVASEKTIRDLAARMSSRIGIPVRFESDRSKKYKGKLEDLLGEVGAFINLAYATLDTPIHEILGHPIIRAIKYKKFDTNTDNMSFEDMVDVYNEHKDKKEFSQLYQNLLKELEYGKGKEVLDRVKRDYNIKSKKSGHLTAFNTNEFKEFVITKQSEITDDLSKYGIYAEVGDVIVNDGGIFRLVDKENFENNNKSSGRILGFKIVNSILENHEQAEYYTLEEQQEEAIVELLGLMTAEKLDNVKDGKLVSLLKRLLKEMKQFVRSLLNQKEVEIDKLPDNMTLGDIADLLAYSNSKLILTGNEVVYTTPDNQKFKTYAEASKHISDLAKSVEYVDLSNISLDSKLSQEDLQKIERLENKKKEKENYFNSEKYQQDKEFELNRLNKELEELKNKKLEFYSQEPSLDLEDKEKYGFQDFDYVRVESTYGRGNKYHKDILGESYEGYYIHGYNTSKGKPEKKILPITKEQAINIWEKDENHKYEIEDTLEIFGIEDSIRSLKKDKKIKYEISSIDEAIKSIKEGVGTIHEFIKRNKEYEQSKEIIEEWKRVNNIQYNPDEVYSRGQEFTSVVGAYSNFDVNLMMQNLLQHIEDNQKAGGEFVISAFTKPSDRIIPHLEGGGGKIKFKIYPKSEDIKWAANSDAYSGSVWDASEKVNKDKESELLGVSYTKYPSLDNIDSIQPNLASIIDNLSDHHNELGISLTGGNFRLEYSGDIPHSTKKIIDSINSILDEKYGKLVKPEIKEKNIKEETTYDLVILDDNGYPKATAKKGFKTLEEAKQFGEENKDKYIKYSGSYKYTKVVTRTTGIKPTQTNETLKESIDSVKSKYSNEVEDTDGFGSFGYDVNGVRYVRSEDGMYSKSVDGLKTWVEITKEEYESNKPEKKIKEKEYTSQAIINTKIAKLKEVAKRYPRSLIISEVRPINNVYPGNAFDEEVLPFQKLSGSNTVVGSDERVNQPDVTITTNNNTTDEAFLERPTPPGVNNESGILPLEANRELYKSLGLIDKNGVDIKVWSYKVWGSNPAKIRESVLNKKNSRSDIEGRYEFILRDHPNGLGYAIWLRAKEVDPLTKGQLSMFQRDNITNNVISGAKKSFSFNDLRRSTKKVMVSIANEMSSRFGIAFSIISQDELAALEAKYNVRLSNSRGFYIHQERKAYLVEGKFSESTAVHEIFGHPFLEMLKSSPELWHIYNNLATEAFKKYSKVSAISALYSDKSDRTQTDELIIRLLTDEIESRSTDKGIASAIRAYTKAFFRFVRSVFNKNTSYTNMNMKISISSLADYVMYGKGEINLLSTQDKSDYAETVNKILSAFGKPNSKSRVTSLASINEAIAVHGGDFSSMIDGYKNDAGIPNMRFLNIGLKSMANTVEDGIVYDSSNKKIGEYTMSDGVLTIISGNEKDIILSILNHESNQNTKISILSNNIDSLYMHMLNCLPHQCFVIQSNNGVESIVYNKEVRDMYSPVLDVDFERISGDTIHDNNVAAFISTISDGLKAQLHMLERKQSTSKEYLDKIKKLIEDIDTYGEVDVILKFIDHAEKEVNKVVKQINIATEQMTLGEQVDRVMLNDMRRNFITLYKSAFDSIARINSNYAGIMSTLPAAHKAATDAKIDAISKSLMYIESSFYNIQKYAYGNLLIEEGEEKRGSNTIRDRFKREANGRVLDDFYVDRRDVGLLHTVLGNALFSGSEQVRILDRIVSDVNSEVNRAMETDGIIVNLYRAWKEVRSKNKLATFSSIMEHDENGKATGYISHRLKYGKFNAEYNKFIATLKEKYGIAEFDSLPENDDDKRNFILEKEEWLSRNVERTYTPEYYKLRKSLSPSVTEVLDESEDRIRSFTSKFRGENGKLDTRMMTEKDKNDLFYLQKEKQCLSMFIFPDGTPKMEGTEEYKMAVELQDFYSKLYKNVQFKPNFEAFNEAMGIARESMTESQFNTWLKDNTKVHIEQSFYDSLSSADTEYQTDDWNRMYNIRKNLLKLYRDPNSMEVSANRIKESDATYERDLLATIKRIDIYLNENRVKSETKSNFGDIAEIVPTEEYQIMLDYLVEHINDEGGQAAYDAWHKEAHYIDSKGRLNRYSYYNKMEPIDKSLITRVPSGIWSEIDEASPYFNKKYDRSLEKYGMQPSEALYDNSKAFRAIESKPEVLAFRDALEASYEAANSHYGYISRPNNLRLAQIPGGFLHKVAHGSSGIISGLREALSDEFHYREYDDVLGDYSSKDKFYADGSPVMVVPTRFRKMLDNPDQISRDLLSSFAMYYKAALNFSKMNEKTPDIELLLEGIKNTSVINDKERITAGRTNMYQKALEYVNTEVYGRDLANDYELTYRQFNPFKWIYNKISKKQKDSQQPFRAKDKYNKISLSKPIRNRLTSFVRIVNLSKNVKAAFGNFSSAAVHLKIEAGCGIFTTNKTYALAKLEVARRMPESLASIFNRSDDKLISMMRYFGIGRSNEADMKNLHGSRLGRALAEQFWYGEYSAGDFAIKSQMMVSVLMNIKPYKDESGKYRFYQREQFASKFYKGDRLAGLQAFDTISDNLYGAMEVVDGVLGIKEKYNTGEYEGSISNDTLNYAAGILGTLSRTLDGSLTGVERSRVHKDVFGSMLLLHRNYLLWAVQERFHGEMFRYDKGMMATGMYRGKTLKVFPAIAFKVIMSKLTQIATLNKVKDVTGYNSKYSTSDIANSKRMLGEYAAFLVLATGAILMTKSIGDDDDKRKESLEMWAYILLLRTTLEVGSLSSPIELWNLQKNPSAAQSFFQAAKDLYDMHSDGTYNSTIKSGIYKNKTKRFRSLTKMMPIWKNIYPSFVAPDLRNDERFIKTNVGTTYDRLDHIIYPENPRRKEDKEKDKKKKTGKTIVL